MYMYNYYITYHYSHIHVSTHVSVYDYVVYNDCTIDILMNNYTITIVISCRTRALVYGLPHFMDTQILFNIC